MKNLNFSPLLISVLAGKSLGNIPETPCLSDLPGKHVQLVANHIDKVKSPFEHHIEPLICGNCGKKAKYNLGITVINPQKFNKDVDATKYMQSTGYFRCKYCNSAGNWEPTAEFLTSSIMALLAMNANIPTSRFQFGEFRMYDGSKHPYASDAEEHLLKKLNASNNDAFIWNRLGNLYYKGGRPDLAVCAFERSLEHDPWQTESLFTLGDILVKVGSEKEGVHYLHKMLVSASHYKKMDAVALRNIISEALLILLNLNLHSNNEISMIPPKELYEEMNPNFQDTSEKIITTLDIEVFPNDPESIFPLAERYMGKRSKELPRKKQLHAVKKKKKRKKRK